MMKAKHFKVLSLMMLLLLCGYFPSINAEDRVEPLPDFEVYSVESLQNDLNRQLNLELESSYLYLGLSSYFSSRSLDGFAHWFRLQADEERGHAQRILNFLIDKEIPVLLTDIKIRNYQVSSALEAFETGLQHEKMITTSIHGIYASANGSDLLDRDVQVFLNWFIAEQVEEESMFQRIVDKLKIIGDSADGLIILDQELGRRTAANAN